ncbi:hypothetical protein BH09ACT8_BH09ACT8_30390 [soil metagenome]
MRGSGVDVGPLGILPIRASALRTPETVNRWLASVGPAERGRQVAAMSKAQLAHFVILLDTSAGGDLLGSIDADLAARVIRSADSAQAQRFQTHRRSGADH